MGKIKLGVYFVLSIIFAPSILNADVLPLKVVTTTTMIEDIVLNVGGGYVNVESLMGPGVDPHMYKPTAWDATKLRSADVIFFNGMFLEGKMSALFERMQEQGYAVYPVTESIPDSEKIYPSLSQGHPDPHVWFDPSLWIYAIQSVVDQLSILRPELESVFEKNGDAYKKEVIQVHDKIKAKVQRLPEEKRILITSHDAFNYFGRAYVFTVIGVQGVSTVTEAGLADVVSVVDLIKEKEIKSIFVETSVSPALIERISRDAHVNVGGELFSDSLGVPDERRKTFAGEAYDVGTYLGMIQYNALTIVEALD